MLLHKLLAFALIFLASAQLRFAADSSDCPANFELVGDTCIYFNDTWRTWYEADRDCHSINAGLLSFKNQAQFEAINDYLLEKQTLQVWTSGNCLGKAGDYYWQNTGQAIRYFNWGSGQPDTQAGDCLAIMANFTMNSAFVIHNYKLGQDKCTTWSAYVCQIEPQQYKTLVCLNTDAFYEAKVPVL